MTVNERNLLLLLFIISQLGCVLAVVLVRVGTVVVAPLPAGISD